MAEEVPTKAAEEGEASAPPPASTAPAGRLGVRRLVAPLREADATASARRRVLDARLIPEESQADAAPPGSTPDPSPERLGSRPPLEPRGEPSGPAAPRSSRLHDPASVRPLRRGEPQAFDRAAAALSLSPRMTAVFGGLFGLATVTTIIALLIQGVPPRDDRALVAAGPSGTAVGSADAPPEAPPGPAKRVRTKVPGPWRIADAAKDPGTRVVEGKFDRRSFIVALSEAGVPKDQIYRILKAFDGLQKFDRLGRNDRFSVLLDRESKAVRAFEFAVSPLEVWQAREVDGLLRAGALDMKIAHEEIAGAFYVGKNLARSIEWGGFEPSLAKAIDEALAGRMSTEGFEEGGTVRIVIDEVTALGDFADYGDVVALEYRPPDPAATPVRAYTFKGPTSKGIFDERGRQPDGSGWVSPVPGAPITSRFNPKRMHPVLKRVQPHNGTDYGAPTGTPIYAAFRGKLSFVGNGGPCGNMVTITHPNGIETVYCHLSKFAAGLKTGAKVGTRQLVGYVGSTGRSTGPHLHFGAKKDGKWFDSETLKIDGFRVIPPDERPLFATRKAELDARLDAIPLPEPPPAEPDPKSATADASPDTSAKAAPAAPEPEDPTDAPPAAPTGDKPAAPPSSDDGEDIVGPDLGL